MNKKFLQIKKLQLSESENMTLFRKDKKPAWDYKSVVEHLLSMCKTQSLIPTKTKQSEKHNIEFLNTEFEVLCCNINCAGQNAK